MKKVIFILIIIIVSTFSCVKKEEDSFYVTGGPTIDRTHHFPVDTLGTDVCTLSIEICADPIYDSLTVNLNGEILTDLSVEDNVTTFTRTISTNMVEYDLEIESNLGNASAICSMPGPFKIPEPDSLWIIPAQDCRIRWEKAANAQWYQVDIAWFDTIYPYQNNGDTTLYFNDTSLITIKGNNISFYGTMIVLVTAGNGARLLPGDKGNIEGDANGYWVARSKTRRAIKIGYW